MKKRVLAALAACALVVTACAPSVESLRAQALEDLEQMSGLTRAQKDEIGFELKLSSDAASIEHTMKKAQEKIEKRQIAHDAQEKRDQLTAEFAQKVPGSTIVLEQSDKYPNCVGTETKFNLDGTLHVEFPDQCELKGVMPPSTWTVENTPEFLKKGPALEGAHHHVLSEEAGLYEVEPEGMAMFMIPRGKYRFK